MNNEPTGLKEYVQGASEVARSTQSDRAKVGIWVFVGVCVVAAIPLVGNVVRNTHPIWSLVMIVVVAIVGVIIVQLIRYVDQPQRKVKAAKQNSRGHGHSASG